MPPRALAAFGEVAPKRESISPNKGPRQISARGAYPPPPLYPLQRIFSSGTECPPGGALDNDDTRFSCKVQT